MHHSTASVPICLTEVAYFFSYYAGLIVLYSRNQLVWLPNTKVTPPICIEQLIIYVLWTFVLCVYSYIYIDIYLYVNVPYIVLYSVLLYWLSNGDREDLNHFSFSGFTSESLVLYVL